MTTPRVRHATPPGYPGDDGPVPAIIAAHRAQVRGLFAELLSAFPAGRRAAPTDQLVLLYDGTMIGAQLDHRPRAARRAQAAARHLLPDPRSRSCSHTARYSQEGSDDEHTAAR